MSSNSDPVLTNIWEGVYSSFGEVPATGEKFESPRWVEACRAKVLELKETAKDQRTVPESVSYNGSLLPFMAAIMAGETGEVTILDFGGGLELDYLRVVFAMPDPCSVRCHIIENSIVCEAGQRIFGDDSRVEFHTSIPEDLQAVNIVHLGSSLHYIEDWRTAIQKLTAYRPHYVLFTDLIAGDIPTYATGQNYYGSIIPCWFFNINEIVDAMSNAGFQLIFKSTFDATILGKQQELPQENFPPELRLGKAISLLFRLAQSSV
jgi:putative methyltransferase (TIGR04325 family)